MRVNSSIKAILGILLLVLFSMLSAFSQRLPSNSGDWVNPHAYGAVGDGRSHPISEHDISSHPDWMGRYKVGDEWDYVALQEAVYAAFGPPGEVRSNSLVQLNRPLFIPCGRYRINEEWMWTHIVGGWIRGGGRLCTIIVQTSPNKAVVRTNGFSFNRVEGISFQEAADNQGASFELDWDGRGKNWSAALQGNTFADNQFSAEGHNDAFGVRIAASGYMGSENLFLDNHFQWFRKACFVSSAFNALQNTVIGGNFASCQHDGIYVREGAIQVYSVGFQNGVLSQTGWDVEIANSADDISSVENSRTESAHFVRAVNLHRARLVGNHQAIAYSFWQADHQYRKNSFVTGTLASGKADGKLYWAGSDCSSGTTEPLWLGLGSVSDGTCKWEYVNIVSVAGSNLRLYDNHFMFGTVQVSGPAYASLLIGNTFTRRDWLKGDPYGSSPNLVLQFGNSVYLSGGVNEGGSAVPWGTPMSGAYQAISQLNLGDSALLWSDGAGGSLHAEAGFVKASPGILDSIGGFSAGIEEIASTATATIDCKRGNTHQLTLQRDAKATIVGCYPGQEIVTVVCQPEVTPTYNFAFPTSFRGVSEVSRRPNTCTSQAFRWNGNTAYATAAGIVSER